MLTDLEYLNNINEQLKKMEEIVDGMAVQVREVLINKRSGMKQQIYELSKNTQIKEEEVVETCVESLIRYQPLASDLRAVTVAMKVSYDLSRVSRYLYNIVEMQNEFNLRECDIGEIISLYDEGIEMVRRSMKAYFARDVKAAAEICSDDDSIDHRYRQILEEYKSLGVFSGECILFNGMSARTIERMADHACYISHEIMYLVTGRRSYFR